MTGGQAAGGCKGGCRADGLAVVASVAAARQAFAPLGLGEQQLVLLRPAVQVQVQADVVLLLPPLQVLQRLALLLRTAGQLVGYTPLARQGSPGKGGRVQDNGDERQDGKQMSVSWSQWAAESGQKAATLCKRNVSECCLNNPCQER